MTADEREVLLNEAVSLLNRNDSSGALKTLRRLEGLVNVWQCQECNYQSSKTSEAGCPMCSGDVKAVVVRAYSESQPAQEADDPRNKLWQMNENPKPRPAVTVEALAKAMENRAFAGGHTERWIREHEELFNSMARVAFDMMGGGK